MSRVGQAPISVPSGVEVTVSSGDVAVKGPRGELSRRVPKGIALERSDGEIRVTRANDEREVRALHGLVRSLVANMVQGVTQGYERRLEIHGVGYRAAKRGDDIEFQIGFSHSVVKKAPSGIEFELPTPTRIVVRGIDKELVGQVAAEIRAIRKPEPYKAKGIRYEGEHIKRKAGKAAKAGG
ncbi:MAG: 50S ribosomal protein L6 [Actinobacteria bacterium]|nr:50S ribosomal protein L6 [Actinomycetota bacterium]MDQ3218572.1 50S ribosomal protein L6 [Actinomycetota bacterium]